VGELFRFLFDGENALHVFLELGDTVRSRSEPEIFQDRVRGYLLGRSFTSVKNAVFLR